MDFLWEWSQDLACILSDLDAAATIKAAKSFPSNTFDDFHKTTDINAAHETTYTAQAKQALRIERVATKSD